MMGKDNKLKRQVQRKAAPPKPKQPDVPAVKVTLTYTPSCSAKTGTVMAEVDGKTVYLDNSLNPLNAKHRTRFTKALATKVDGLDATDTEQKLLEIAEEFLQWDHGSAAECTAPSRQDQPNAVSTDSAALLAAMPVAVREDASRMLHDPLLIKRIVEDIADLGVAGECDLTATLYLVGTSRLLERPLNCIVQGPSASGKSYPIEKVAELFPREAVILAKQMTPQALFHMPPGALVHKFIVAGERSRRENDESAEATRALREMQASGKLSKLMPVKVGNAIETQLIEQDGPIAYVESTTLPRIFEEDANRCILLQTDERPAQTRRVYRATAARYSGKRKCTDAVVQRHHAAQRMLQSMEVIIPFAERLAELFPTDKVEGRRAIGHLLGTIATITLLHQFQRQRDEAGRLLATADDYQIATHLLNGPLGRLLGHRVSDAARRLFERLQKKWPAQQFTTTEVTKGETVSDRAVRGWLGELHDGGLVELVEESRGRKPSTWKVVADQADAAQTAELPTMKQVFPGVAFQHSVKEQTGMDNGLMSELERIFGNDPPTEPCPSPGVAFQHSVKEQSLTDNALMSEAERIVGNDPTTERWRCQNLPGTAENDETSAYGMGF